MRLRERRGFTDDQIDTARRRQDAKCPCCGRSLARGHYDVDAHHRNGDRGDNSTDNLVLVCEPCHHNCYHRTRRAARQPQTCRVMGDRCPVTTGSLAKLERQLARVRVRLIAAYLVEQNTDEVKRVLADVREADVQPLTIDLKLHLLSREYKSLDLSRIEQLMELFVHCLEEARPPAQTSSVEGPSEAEPTSEKVGKGNDDADA